jgi:predicted DNA-binding transcriptional regulator AlpA
VKITKHASGYIAGEIEGWIEARMNERDERGVK